MYYSSIMHHTVCDLQHCIKQMCFWRHRGIWIRRCHSERQCILLYSDVQKLWISKSLQKASECGHHLCQYSPFSARVQWRHTILTQLFALARADQLYGSWLHFRPCTYCTYMYTISHGLSLLTDWLTDWLTGGRSRWGVGLTLLLLYIVMPLTCLLMQ